MRREGFNSVFWGLLFVVVDIRLGAFDLILPDFIGYGLIFQGLGLLAAEHRGFRTARVLAAVMIFVSLTSLGENRSAPLDPAFIRRQVISAFTGDLSALLPEEVHSARLVGTTRSRSAIDANRTQNPQGDEDALLGKYSDGTTVLILRYASPEEAVRALDRKTETDYSFEAIRKRAKTDESFRAEQMSGSKGEGGSSGSTDSADWRITAADRMIQQWWNKGWSWWWPSNSLHRGGWNRNIVYIVEGYESSAGSFRSALEGKRQEQGGVTINPLFLYSILGEILTALMIWQICSGIVALSLSSSQDALSLIANQRRVLYMAFTVTGWAFSATWFFAPELSLSDAPIAGAIAVYALAGLVAMVLIMALMRRAANSLEVPAHV
ncbi:MAG TPA: hypothetical protein VF618_02360 [Thermoanaerobaculia bacterium]